MSHYWKVNHYYRKSNEFIAKSRSQDNTLDEFSWQRLDNDHVSVIIKEDGPTQLKVQCSTITGALPIILEEVLLTKKRIQDAKIQFLWDGVHFGVNFRDDSIETVERRFILTFRNKYDSDSFLLILGRYVNIDTKIPSPNSGSALLAPDLEKRQEPLSFLSQSPNGAVIELDRNVRENNSYTTPRIEHSKSTAKGLRPDQNEDDIKFDIKTTDNSELRDMFSRAIMSTEFRDLLLEASKLYKS